MIGKIDPASDGRALEAKQDKIIEALGESSNYILTALYTATIGATSIIPTAFTATLPANTVRIVLIPRGDIYWKINDAASATTAKIPVAGISLPVTKALADTIQVFAASVACDLLVCTPR